MFQTRGADNENDDILGLSDDEAEEARRVAKNKQWRNESEEKGRREERVRAFQFESERDALRVQLNEIIASRDKKFAEYEAEVKRLNDAAAEQKTAYEAEKQRIQNEIHNLTAELEGARARAVQAKDDYEKAYTDIQDTLQSTLKELENERSKLIEAKKEIDTEKGATAASRKIVQEERQAALVAEEKLSVKENEFEKQREIWDILERELDRRCDVEKEGRIRAEVLADECSKKNDALRAQITELQHSLRDKEAMGGAMREPVQNDAVRDEEELCEKRRVLSAEIRCALPNVRIHEYSVFLWNIDSSGSSHPLEINYFSREKERERENHDFHFSLSIALFPSLTRTDGFMVSQSGWLSPQTVTPISPLKVLLVGVVQWALQ